MSATTETSDASILDLLRQQGPQAVVALAAATGVTATAVRQRLNRLMGEGLIERRLQRAGRGRPSHRYSLTDKGQRAAGTNYGDLAVTLWQEIRGVASPDVRRGLLQRIAKALAARYSDRVKGQSLAERMESVGQVFGDRKVPFQVGGSEEFPVLTAMACPYPDLAEQDRAVCAMERLLFTELLDADVKLTQCRLDGANCCTFEAN